MIATISSMMGREFCKAVWVAKVVVAVGLVASGRGRVDNVEWRGEDGRRSDKAEIS